MQLVNCYVQKLSCLFPLKLINLGLEGGRDMPRLVVVVVICMAILGCNQPNRTAQAPSQIEVRPITATLTGPVEIAAGESVEVSIKGTNLDQVTAVRVPPEFTVSELKAGPDTVTFRLEASKTAALPELTLRLLTANDRVVTLDSPLMVSVVTAQEQTLRILQGQYEDISESLKILQSSADSANQLSANLNTLQGTVSKQGDQLVLLRGALTTLQEQVSAQQKWSNEQITAMQQRQTEFGQQLAQTRTLLDNQLTTLRTSMAQVLEGQRQQRVYDQALAEAIVEIGSREVGGFFGIGDKSLLSEEKLSQIRSLIQAPPPPNSDLRVSPAR
jgi:hypothetical protein